MDCTFNCYAPSDGEEVLSLLQEVLPLEGFTEQRFTRQVLLDPNFREQGAVVGRVGGEIAGFCLAVARQVPLENAPPDADRGYITLLGVRPQWRRQGIGRALIQTAEEYLLEQGRTIALVSPYAPGYFFPGVDVAACEPALQLFKSCGYSELHRPLAMQCSLWQFQTPQWVSQRAGALALDSLHISSYRPALLLPLLQFVRREFPGDWVRVVREAVTAILDGEPASRLLVAHRDGEVVGFCHSLRERFGPIGVAKEWRGRGIAQVLMFRALEAMRGAGFRCAWFLWSDDATARRLYDAAGFQEVRRFAVLKKELESAK